MQSYQVCDEDEKDDDLVDDNHVMAMPLNGDVDGDNESLQAFLTSLCGLSPWEDLSPSTS